MVPRFRSTPYKFPPRPWPSPSSSPRTCPHALQAWQIAPEPRLFPANFLRASAFRVPSTPAAPGTPRTRSYAPALRPLARVRAAHPDTEAPPSRRSVSSLAPRRGSAQPGRDLLQRPPQLMPRAQQQHPNKGPPHAQRLRDFVVTHIRVVPQRQRHPRPVRQLLERLPHLLARMLFKQSLQLPRIRMLQRHAFNVARFQVLPHA